MQTIQLNVDDKFYDDIVKSGIDVQNELKGMMQKLIYKKEYQIAQDIKEGLDEVELHKQGKIELKDAHSLLSELKSAD